MSSLALSPHPAARPRALSPSSILASLLHHMCKRGPSLCPAERTSQPRTLKIWLYWLFFARSCISASPSPEKEHNYNAQSSRLLGSLLCHLTLITIMCAGIHSIYMTFHFNTLESQSPPTAQASLHHCDKYTSN